MEKTDVVNEAVPPQVVFLEQCIKLVKKKGQIGIVVPESMISNKKYAYVVELIFEKCYVKSVIGMPDDLFKTSGKGGTHTKTCLLVLEKKAEADINDYNIFMAEAKWCGHDSRGREIPNDDIPIIVKKYLDYIKTGKVDNSHLSFLIKQSDITNNVLAPRAYVHTMTENTYDHWGEGAGSVIGTKLVSQIGSVQGFRMEILSVDENGRLQKYGEASKVQVSLANDYEDFRTVYGLNGREDITEEEYTRFWTELYQSEGINNYEGYWLSTDLSYDEVILEIKNYVMPG